MGSSRRNRERKPGRRPASRDPKPKILVVCEGAVTEPEYLGGFQRAVKNPRVDIEIAPEHGVPATLVQVAKERKRASQEKAAREGDENLAYDAVWCVFDIDDHQKLPHAVQMARDNGIDLAVSNPSFELWLLLHFHKSPGMQHRDRIAEMLRVHLPRYDKHVNYRDFAAGYSDAVNRARQLDALARQVDEPGRNPTTGVYRLTESIRND